MLRPLLHIPLALSLLVAHASADDKDGVKESMRKVLIHFVGMTGMKQ
jgi:hypothetical protein